MAGISFEEFQAWLAGYGAAWERGDAGAIITLFAEESRYYENPFAEPMIGSDALHHYWSEGAGDGQRDVRFTHQAVAVAGRTGLARWSATFVRVPSGSRVELDGFLTAEFDASGKCVLFREWWHRREGGSVEAA